MLINKWKSTDIKHFNDSEASIKYCNTLDDIYINIEKCSLKKQQILIAIDNMITDLFSKKKLNPIVIELFTGSRKLNISLLLTTQSYFAIPKKNQLNSIRNINVKILKSECYKKSHLIIHHILTFNTL